MALAFSDTTNKLGIVEQTRTFTRTDSNQWSTAKIVTSCNNWLDRLTGYAIGADKRFQWDNTNQTKLPEGTTDLVQDQTDYSFLTDEQGNQIVTLTGISVLRNGSYVALTQIDRNDPTIDSAHFGTTRGVITSYDKIADNVIRLDAKPDANVDAGLKFYFQRTSPYYAATDTTKTTGFSALLDRGFVIASAYDCALTLGLPNMQALSVELEKEERKMIEYFEGRNNDEKRLLKPIGIQFR
jgi:hypothetical protein